MARKKSVAEEEIIDLTDFIEDGPEKRAPAQAAPATDFGALLDEVDIPPAPARPAAPRPVDPNEELDMSEMGRIDNIFESMDIPPQPGESSAPAASAPSPDDELDALMGEDFGSSASKLSAPTTYTASGKPAKTTVEEDLKADLDDILDSFPE
ncbi:MAG: hypothetical protein K2H64_13025, partial [Desulfovibrio sp.]|nr:hypothetical protein [Desulfovibrio sp.]